jgi:hypothetical protein
MRLMLAAMPAKLAHFQAFGGGFLVFGGRIVSILALCALERNDFSRHILLLAL